MNKKEKKHTPKDTEGDTEPKYIWDTIKLLKCLKPTLRTECPADSNHHKCYVPTT